MPIILAIEPDRRQRDALAAVVRQRVGAELILADTTERALEAIGNRVPDLVLVPALLAPQDDAALAAALRVIAAAAHVRTLTIPVLAAHAEAAPSSGLLSRWRRGRSASPAPDGCDPAVFAEQIVAYLKESAAERALMVDDVEDDLHGNESEYAQEFGREDVQAGANAYVQADAQTYVRTDAQAYLPDPVGADPVGAGLETGPHWDGLKAVPYMQPDVQTYAQAIPADVARAFQASVAIPAPYAQTDVQASCAQPDVQTYSQPDVQPYIQADVQNEVLDVVEGDEYDTTRAGTDGLTTLRLNQEEDIDLSNELAELETEEADGTRGETSETELFDGEPVGVYTMPAVIDEPEVDVAVLAARKAFAEAEAAIAVDPEFFAEAFAEPVFEAEPRTEPVFEDDAAVARAFEAETIDSAPVVEDINPEDAEPEPADAEPWVSAFLSPRWAWPVMEGVPTEPPAAFVPVEVAVAEPRPAPAPHKRDRPEWSELVASLRKDIERRRVEPPQEKPKPNAHVQVPRRSRKSKPVQDEWGFFDPEQCGFAALLAKLDEITEGAEDIVEVHRSS